MTDKLEQHSEDALLARFEIFDKTSVDARIFIDMRFAAFKAGYAAGLAARDEWQPIETAPKDGTEVWLFIPNDEPQQVVGYFENKESVYKFWAYKEQLVQDVQGLAQPTHWKSLPNPPKVKP